MELLRDCLTLGVPCMAMARPSGGPFVLSDAERARTVLDAARMIDLGAHGVVFGGITPAGARDDALIAAVVRVVDDVETVFHRAFDHATDATAALEVLIEAGVSRVLTGGHRGGAWDGRAALAHPPRRRRPRTARPRPPQRDRGRSAPCASDRPRCDRRAPRGRPLSR